MSSGEAECPLEEITYFGLLPSPDSATRDGGREVGALLYVYGSVTAEGSERKGEIVKGIWARRGWVSDEGQALTLEGI